MFVPSMLIGPPLNERPFHNSKWKTSRWWSTPYATASMQTMAFYSGTMMIFFLSKKYRQCSRIVFYPVQIAFSLVLTCSRSSWSTWRCVHTLWASLIRINVKYLPQIFVLNIVNWAHILEKMRPYFAWAFNLNMCLNLSCPHIFFESSKAVRYQWIVYYKSEFDQTYIYCISAYEWLFENLQTTSRDLTVNRWLLMDRVTWWLKCLTCN